METIYDKLKYKINDCHKIINIHKSDSCYMVDYISIDQCSSTSAPKFNTNTKRFTLESLKGELRDIKIEELLDISEEQCEFDVEEYIYTEEQREKLYSLRNKNKKLGLYESLKSIRKEYSETFQINQRVWYNNNPGIISFRHVDKDENDITRWSVKVKDTEFRYINGTELLDRKIRDLSYVPIDPELNRLSTIKLLKLLRRSRDRNKGIGRSDVKRILQDREHIRRDNDKIIINGKVK